MSDTRGCDVAVPRLSLSDWVSEACVKYRGSRVEGFELCGRVWSA